MKKILIATALLFAFTGCKKINSAKEKVKEASSTVSKAREAVSNTSKMAKEAESMQEDLEKLSEMESLTNEELKAWLPEEVGSMKRVSYKVGGESKMLGITSVDAKFADEDNSKSFTIKVIDGAGNGTMFISGIRMGLTMDMEEETEKYAKRIEDHKNGKAMVEYQKDGSSSKISQIVNSRFIVEAKGENMDLDELWKVVDKMDATKLGK